MRRLERRWGSSSTRRWRYDFRTAAILALVALCVASCQAPPRSVIETAVRLTNHLTKPQPGIPKRCALGGELRPAWGCPPFLFLTETTGDRVENHFEVRGKAPEEMLGTATVLAPAIRADKRGAPQDLGPRAFHETPAEAKLSYPYDQASMEQISSVEVLVHPLSDLHRRYETQDIDIPRGAKLSLGIGLSPLGAATKPGATLFVVEAITAAGEEELLRETLLPTQADQWLDRIIDLEKLEDRSIRFRFTSQTEPGTDFSQKTSGFAFWGNPEIRISRPRDKRRNILLISLDTLRADHFGPPVGGINLTPFFEEIRSQGSVFHQAISTFPSTTASHMSLFTATYPATHRVHFPLHRLADEFVTLPEALAAAGYQTAAVTENAMILAGSGFVHGFDSYRENQATWSTSGSIDETFSQGIQWLENNPDELFFLFLHTYEVHSPYTPRPELLDTIPTDASWVESTNPGMRRAARAYAAEVRYIDDALRRLFGKLEALGVLEETLIVITSDHGEEFGERGQLGHAKSVFDEVLRIPLFFWAPGLIPGGGTIEEQVSLVDVGPTILDLVGLSNDLEKNVASELVGSSLAAALLEKSPADGKVHFAEGRLKKVRTVAARTAKHKWVWREDRPSLLVYDLSDDPGEKAPRNDPELLERGQALIDSYLVLDRIPIPTPAPNPKESTAPQASASAAVVLRDSTVRKLEALGYLD